MLPTNDGAAGGDVRCPWCGRGRIVLHGPDEPWVVTEEGPKATARRQARGKAVAGERHLRFRTAPVRWFSCTECFAEGTVAYMALMIRGRVGSAVRSLPAVSAAESAAVLGASAAV